MTDLINRPESGNGSSLYRERFLTVVESGQATWPSIERRRGPRRRAEEQLPPDRRIAQIPAQPTPIDVPQGRALRRDRHVTAYRRTVVAIDIVVAALAAVFAQVERFGTGPEGHSTRYWWGVLALPVFWVAGVSASRAYESRYLGSSAEEYRRVINAAVGLTATIAVVSYLSKTQFARGYVILALPACAMASLLGRYVARRGLRHARARGRFLQDVVVVGHEWPVLDLVAELRRNPDSGLRVVGACVPGGRGSRQMVQAGVPVVGDINQVAESVIRLRADVLAVTTCVEFGGPELRKVCWALENTDVDVVVAPALIEVAGPRLHIRPVDRLPLLHVEKPEFTGARRIVKGAFDRVVAAAALTLLSPVLFAIAIAVRLTSAGPAMFRQTRVGVRGVPFTIYKFRSMHGNAESTKHELEHFNDNADGLLFKMRADPRVTKVGRILRRYSLDELPQLINVLKGEMSLVGPRPPLPGEVEHYADDVRRRLLVRARRYRPLAGQRALRPLVGRLGTTRPAVRRELVARLGLRDSVEDGVRGLSRVRRLLTMSRVSLQPHVQGFDVVVVGGGIVGLASARALSERQPGIRVCVLEKEDAVGRHQTRRNSGVVHAGIYYAPGSLKATLCTSGREAMKAYTQERGLPYDECGKLIVALRDEELPRLHELQRRAEANGVPGVRLLDERELREIEPSARGIAALHSPVTAITDFAAVAASYARDIAAAQGTVITGFTVTAIEQDADSVTIKARDGRVVRAAQVLVCAGLHGDRVAALAGDTADPRIVPFRGDYFRLAPAKAALIRGLIYPVPDPDLPFLGVHLTRTVAGEVLVGPNAVLATAREGYRASVIRPRDLASTLMWPGFWKFGRKYWRVGAAEMRRATSRRIFAAAAAQYVPGVGAADLERSPAGVRAQALSADGRLVDDFAITQVGRVVSVRNAPSPAATSSLPIGAELARRVLAGEPAISCP